MKLNHSLLLLCFFSSTSHILGTLTVSQYAPDSYFQKPYYTEKEFQTVLANFTTGYAAHAYNQDSQRVPFLQQFGSEDFLQRFVDPSINSTNTTSLGKGKLSGDFQYRQLILSSYKNIMRNFFIEAATSIQDLTVKNIDAEFVAPQESLTQDQIIYLEQLQKSIPDSINRSGMFSTAFYLGYSASFSNFKHLDFVDILIKGGFASPECMQDNNNSIVEFPFNNNLNFGYPVIGALSMGVLDWLTFGFNGTIEPFQPAMKQIAVNNTNSDNTLLLPLKTIAIIHRGPLFSTSAYIEIDHIAAGISITGGYTYTKNLAYKIQPLNQTDFSLANANQSSMFNEWSLGSFYFQFDVDFACEAMPSAPVIAIFCVIPYSGELCPETNLFGGSCNFQISYAF